MRLVEWYLIVDQLGKVGIKYEHLVKMGAHQRLDLLQDTEVVTKLSSSLLTTIM